MSFKFASLEILYEVFHKSLNSNYTPLNNGESMVSSLSGYNDIMTGSSQGTREYGFCIKENLEISLHPFGEAPFRNVFLEFNQNFAKFSSSKFNDFKWNQT